MSDGKMSRDHLEHTLKNAEAGHPMMGKWADRVLAHVTVLEKERDAALADNAALWRLADHAMAAHVGARERPHLLEATKVLAAAHHGAALLEEHRKALEQRDAAMKLAAMTQQTVEMLNARIDQDEIDHAKALVRARNEGLERAATRFDRTGHFWVSQILRAMKEPEESAPPVTMRRRRKR